MKKYKNKYRIPSTRLPSWDYGWNGAYFITICTHNRIHFFGKIIETQNFASKNQSKNFTFRYEMQLSQIGQLAEKYWYEIPEHFPFVKLGAFVVMPNHIHGIIIIDKKNDDNRQMDNVDNVDNVETQNFASLPRPPRPPRPSRQQQPKNKFGPQSQNLASIIRGYKIGVTKSAKKINPLWKWQSRYYDHIIRNEKSFQKISEYIINNPLNWKGDKFYK